MTLSLIVLSPNFFHKLNLILSSTATPSEKNWKNLLEGGGQSDASLGLGMSNMSFLTEDLMQFVFCTMATFSQGDGTKINSKQFSEFGSITHTITHGFYLTGICLSFS